MNIYFRYTKVNIHPLVLILGLPKKDGQRHALHRRAPLVSAQHRRIEQE